jgi:DNA-binding LacI/PurR family transcriptional regulator
VLDGKAAPAAIARMRSNGAAKERRVGLREVARAARVCLMTASLSLRDHPKISKATRERVRRVAGQLGYRPDPEISRLMGRLRASRMQRGSVVVALIDLQSGKAAAMNAYDAKMREGMMRRADELGVSVSVFRVADYDGNLAQLMRVVRARGIRGVILLPSQNPVALDPTISWDGISVLAATTSVLAPRFHQVVPNQYYNMMRLVETMHGRGFKRIGAVLNRSLDERTQHKYSVALAWHGHRERILLLPDEASPAANEKEIARWLRRHRPDLVLAQHADQLAKFLRRRSATRATGAIALISLAGRPDAGIPFQDQLPELIGASAMSLLTGMMHNNETGVPPHAQVTTIDGVMREAG